jgi:hypothetical protein
MRTPLVTVLLLLLLLNPGVLGAKDAREEKRIEHLLQTVESLKGAAFIRNGTEYDAKDAGKHLRMKLKLVIASKLRRTLTTSVPRAHPFPAMPTKSDYPMERPPRQRHSFGQNFESLTMPQASRP